MKRLIAVVLVTLFLTSVAFAGPRYGRGPSEEQVLRVLERLDTLVERLEGTPAAARLEAIMERISARTGVTLPPEEPEYPDSIDDASLM